MRIAKSVISFVNLCFLFLLLLTSACKSQVDSSVSLENTLWVADMHYDDVSKHFISSMAFSFKDSTSSLYEFGTGNKLFNDRYFLEDNYFFIGDKPTPFMMILSQDERELVTAINSTDTVIFKKVEHIKITKENFLKNVLHKTYTLTSSKTGTKSTIYFDDKKILRFNNQLPYEDIPDLTFYRRLYFVDDSNGLLSLIIGNPRSPKLVFLPNDEIDVKDLIIGKLNNFNTKEFTITSYVNNREETYKFELLNNESDTHLLENGIWKRGGNDRLTFDFKKDKTVEITDKGKKRELDWKLDDSGYLVIMTEKNGENIFAINNFGETKTRMGLEIARGAFSDLLNRDNFN